jgi:hypothetical protein
MEMHIKNSSPYVIEFCIGEDEFTLGPDQEVVVEVKNGDCMYFANAY